MAAVFGGARVQLEGLDVRSWLDGGPGAPPRTPHCYRPPDARIRPVRCIVVHTVHGTATATQEASGPVCDAGHDARAMAYARSFARPEARPASSHVIVSGAGTVLQIADFETERTWHAGATNPFSIGIEMDQPTRQDVCGDTIAATVRLLDALTRHFRIQRQIPARRVEGKWQPLLSRVGRLSCDSNGGAARDWWGVLGHNHTTRNRGIGDPGPAIWLALLEAGYEPHDVDERSDLITWRERQLALGMADADADGVPGPKTVARLAAAGYPHGLYVRRPGD